MPWRKRDLKVAFGVRRKRTYLLAIFFDLKGQIPSGRGLGLIFFCWAGMTWRNQNNTVKPRGRLRRRTRVRLHHETTKKEEREDTRLHNRKVGHLLAGHKSAAQNLRQAPVP